MANRVFVFDVNQHLKSGSDAVKINGCLCNVMIRCYNEEQHIGRLLSGIIEQTVQDVEIVVVNSGSTDTTLGYVQVHKS